jgi:hypothetical protein
VVLIVLLCLLFTKVSAAPGTELWQQANAAYRAGRFEEAKVDYLQLVDRKLYSPSLFYNLGNAWFKLGDKGRAILNYKRALILQPNNAVAAANLQTALRAAEGEDPHSFGDFLRPYADWFAITAAGAFWLTFAGAFLWFSGTRLAWVRLELAVFGTIFVLALSFTLWLQEGSKDPSQAVVVESSADLKFGPANSARTVETLSTGQSIRLFSERGEWSLCRTGAGVLGWLPTRKFERLIPE